jgi:capsular exopolysaccharide synthesis family protein
MTQPSPYFIRRSQPIEAEVMDSSFRGKIHDEDERSIDLLNYWITVKKHRWMILSIVLAVLTIVAIRVSMMTPLYTADATILLKPGNPQLLAGHSSQPENAQINDWDSVEDFLKTQCEILKSRTLAANVITAEGLASDPVFLGKKRKPDKGWFSGFTSAKPRATKAAPANAIDDSISSYLGSLEIKPLVNTNLVKIIFTTPNARLSARLANAHAHAYIREGVELRTQANAEAERFLRDKLVELKEKLEKSELALNNYRRDKGIVPGLMSVDGKETVVIARLSDLSKELTSAQVARIGLEAQVDQIRKNQLPQLPSANGNGSAGGPTPGVKAQLDTAMSEYVAMAKQFKPDYPPMVRAKARIDDLQRSYDAEIRAYSQGVVASFNAAKTKEAELQEEMARQRSQALSVNDASVGYAILQREVDTNRELYNSVLGRMKDLGLAAESQSSNTVVVDDAQVPPVPSGPHRAMAILQAIAFGLALGIGLAFLIEYQDKTLKTPEQVEQYLRLPNLAAVPAFSRHEARSIARNNGSDHTPALTGSRELAGSMSQYSVVGEAYRSLRTALMLSRAGSPPKTILFTSASNSEGKTVSALNTAVVFAHTGVRVLLVDVDLRRPRCHKVLALENQAGLTEVLAGACNVTDLIRTTDIDSLSFLSAGSIPPNPSELVGSDKMRDTLAQLTNEFDVVVIDSPPILPVTDAMLLSTMVDGVVLVVNSSKTSKQHVKAAYARLEFARAKVFGVLLNQVDVNSQHYQYYRRYYGGYDTYGPYGADSTDPYDPADNGPGKEV